MAAMLVPSGSWVRATLGEISAFITKGATPTTYGFKWQSSGVRFLRNECLSDRGLNLRHAMYISEDANQALRRSQVANGDLLIAITRSVGRVVRVVGLDRANINQHIARVRIKDPRFDAGFVYHFISQFSVRQHYQAIMTGQAFPQISLKQVRDTEVIGPAIEAQREIATVLDDLDELVVKTECLIAKKQAIRQGMMQRLLSGSTRLPGFSEPWTKTTFGCLGAFLKGRGIKRDDVRASGVACIRYGELYTAFQDYTSVARSFVPSEIAATALSLRSGDVLFAASGETREEIGMCVSYIGPEPAVAGGDIVVLRGSEFNSVYVALLANMPEVINQRARAAQGDAVVHISSRALAAIEVALPPREEQDAIASLVMDADREILGLKTRLRKAKAIRQGTAQQLLTGQTRLPISEEVEA